MQATAAQPKSPPIRPGHFLLGVFPEFRRDPLGLFLRAAREQGDVVALHFGPRTNYMINHPDDIQHVLQTNNRNYRRQKFGNDLIKTVSGLNLFTSDGDYWLQQRRLMQPAFHRKRIHGFGEIMTGVALKTRERWKNAAAEGLYLDISQEMMRLTLEVVGKALFSVDLTDETSQLGWAFTVGINYINYRFNHLLAPPAYIPTRRNRELKKSIQVVNQIMQEMIDERRGKGVQKDDLMDMLLEVRYEDTGKGMTDEQLYGELGIMIGAGHETTSNTLTWAFYALSQHPEIEQRLLAEIDEVLGDRLPTVEDLTNLPLTRRVIDETLRLYPPAWALSTREPLEDDKLGGYPIPANVNGVMILPYVVHRDPRFWDNPEQFDPDRFLPERSEPRHKFAYLPFGDGPRKCIGFLFAQIEAQLALATLLQRFTLRLKPDHLVVPDPIFTLRLKGGLPMVPVSRG